MPYEQRAKLIDKYQAKYQKSKSSSISEITIGSLVCLKSLPLYNVGSIGFVVRNGQPKIGQINEHVFNYRDNKQYTFKVRPVESFEHIVNITSNSVNEMPPPPSPSMMDFSSNNTSTTTTSQPNQTLLTGSLSKIIIFSKITLLKNKNIFFLLKSVKSIRLQVTIHQQLLHHLR